MGNASKPAEQPDECEHTDETKIEEDLSEPGVHIEPCGYGDVSTNRLRWVEGGIDRGEDTNREVDARSEFNRDDPIPHGDAQGGQTTTEVCDWCLRPARNPA